MLSLCRKAGFIAAGEEACLASIRAGKAKLVIICGDASENTKKRFSQKAFYYKVPYYFISSKSETSAAIGTNNSAVSAVTDKGFAFQIEKIINNETGSEKSFEKSIKKNISEELAENEIGEINDETIIQRRRYNAQNENF